ncbi:MAG: PstS family phosphate ABC transporter substrate-binding protein [Leptolyngbya sp. SIO4C1]|nr:PstS family phosphate ABC transporter substrate-binding protein [Leptolyngbya sp. SIO4C1]
MVVRGIQGRLKYVGIAGAVAAAVGLAAAPAISQEVIAIDGSSTVFPITEAMAEEFMGTGADANITVGVSGTGGGFKKFCAGETVISNASRPIKDTEMELCAANGIEYTVIPVAYDAITVVVNPENDFATEMTVEDLKALWEPAAEGTITRWNQLDPSWPDEEISLYGPGTDSGTFDYFTDEIVGEEGASRADYTASEDDNVLVLGVARDPYALGYFGMSYYLENQADLTAVGIDNGEGDEGFVVPSPETIDEYEPLARPIFIYVNTAALNSSSQLRAFVEYYLENASEIVPEVGYVALPESQYSESLAAL